MADLTTLLSQDKLVGVPGPFYNVRGTLLPKWRTAFANMRDGQGDAKILCVGDSTTAGYGSTLFSTFPQLGSWPARLAFLLNSYHAPAQIGLGIPNYFLTDNRWNAVGGVWVQFTFGWGSDASTNGASFGSGAGGGTLTYTPGSTQGTYDKFDVYYLTAVGGGTITCTATGGSAVVQSTNSAASITHLTCTAASAGTGNSVSIVNSGGNPTWIFGVEPWLSTASKIRVANAGVTSSITTQWVGDPVYGGVPCIKAYAPDLTIISLGINDAGTAVATATTVANLQTLITAAQVSGDVILMSYPPSGSGASQWSNYQIYEPLYPDAYGKLAQSLNLPYIDWWSRWNATYQSTLTYTDQVHPNNKGYWDIAGGVFSALRLVA